MVNWTSPQELAKENVAYVNLIFACFGLYVWEVFQTSDFELSILQRRRKLRWEWSTCRGALSYRTFAEPTLVFFFLCRYTLLLSLAGLMATFTIKTAINCQALYTFVCWAGNMSIMCASTTLMLRTVAVWERKLPIVVTLGCLCVAHWALLWRGMFILTAEYDATTMACTVTTTKRLFLGITYWATMGFNLVILVVHFVGLMRRHRGASIGELLFRHGIIYYLVAFSCNALPAVLTVLNLNSVMNLIATVPAAVLSAMAACRTVTCLPDVDDDDDDMYVHSATNIQSPRLPPPSAVRRFQNKANRFPTRPEVHVTTDHIVMQDFDPSPASMSDKAKVPSLVDSDNKSESMSIHAV